MEDPNTDPMTPTPMTPAEGQEEQQPAGEGTPAPAMGGMEGMPDMGGEKEEGAEDGAGQEEQPAA